jgi:hypothetical protein
MRHSVASFKQEELTVHLRNNYELLSLAIRYYKRTVFTTSLTFDVTYSYIKKRKVLHAHVQKYICIHESM